MNEQMWQRKFDGVFDERDVPATPNNLAFKLQTLLAASADGAVRHNNGELVNGKVFDASESEALRPRLRLRLRLAQQRGRHATPHVFPQMRREPFRFTSNNILTYLQSIMFVIVLFEEATKTVKRLFILWCSLGSSVGLPPSLPIIHIVVRRGLSCALHFPGNDKEWSHYAPPRRRHPPHIHADRAADRHRHPSLPHAE